MRTRYVEGLPSPRECLFILLLASPLGFSLLLIGEEHLPLAQMSKEKIKLQAGTFKQEAKRLSISLALAATFNLMMSTPLLFLLINSFSKEPHENSQQPKNFACNNFIIAPLGIIMHATMQLMLISVSYVIPNTLNALYAYYFDPDQEITPYRFENVARKTNLAGATTLILGGLIYGIATIITAAERKDDAVYLCDIAGYCLGLGCLLFSPIAIYGIGVATKETISLASNTYRLCHNKTRNYKESLLNNTKSQKPSYQSMDEIDSIWNPRF